MTRNILAAGKGADSLGALARGLLLALALAVALTGRAYALPGDLDRTFSGDGKQTVNFGGVDGGNVAAPAPGGKIVTAGYSSLGTRNSDCSGTDTMAVARSNADGSPDTTFSGDGKVITDYSSGCEYASGVVAQPDGKVAVVTTSVFGFDYMFIHVLRYNTNGTLDRTFSGDGFAEVAFGGGFDLAGDLALQPDGKLLVAASSLDGLSVARVNSNGTLDSTFGGGDGKVTTAVGTMYDSPSALAVQRDGKIVLVGEADRKFAVVRYTAAGTLDTTFSGDGKQTTDFGSGYDEATDVAIQSDGKIVAVGTYDGPGDADDFALARYNANGTLDTTFSGDGKATVSFGVSDDGFGVAIQGDGKLVVVGSSTPGTVDGYDWAAARLNPNGALDTTFSGDGKLKLNWGGYDSAHSAFIQPVDGKIVVAGRASGDFGLARFLGR